MMRTITEILKEAEATDSLQALCDCWNEIKHNAKKYPLSEIYFAKEHLCELATRMSQNDIKQYGNPLFEYLSKN